MIAGETMFQYLKRQKKGLFTDRSNNQVGKDQKQQSQHLDFQKTQRNNAWNNESNNTQRTLANNKPQKSQSKTPKRTHNVEQPTRNTTRSFIQLISPLRNKSPAVRQDIKNENKQLNDKKAKMKDNYTKYMLQEKINLMRQVIQNFIKQGRHLKEKARLLFIDVKPLFRHLENCEDSGFQRKTQEVKANIKSMESILRDFKTEESQSSISQFYLYFSQHLNELQGNAIAEIHENKTHLENEQLTNKNIQIQELKHQKAKIQRELSLLTKKYEKSENNLESLNQQLQKLREAHGQNDKRKVDHFQSQIAQYVQQIYKLKEEKEILKEQFDMSELQRKQAIFLKKKAESQCLDAISRVKSQQEQFLLHEIVILKKQFSSDINKLSELHKLKEIQFTEKANSQNLQIAKFKDSIEELLSANKNIEQTNAGMRSQNIRYKKHNECLATDMHRINEELYQHWMALKDIKTLSTRLDIFNKFRKIYEELVFNEQLFL